MWYQDLRDFIDQFEVRGKLKRITVPVDTNLETEIADHVLRADGPALIFEKLISCGVPQAMAVLADLFGTPERVAQSMGDDWKKLPMFFQVLNISPWEVRAAPFPVAVVVDCDPAAILGTVMPALDTRSDYQLAGLLRGGNTEWVKCNGSDPRVEARCPQQVARRDASRMGLADRHARGSQGTDRRTVRSAWTVV
ncbi:UbiD family decarboxylase [Denitromonas sp. IR12]|uniref:UbiD family decarboxylase n=1 Tax=Denitromonas iodatirespirans TaxID=2795389 RepID=A0A944D5L3_DENI1|nr:UbiD family decarboxylase [Denitromonas iodatirespirans]